MLTANPRNRALRRIQQMERYYDTLSQAAPLALTEEPFVALAAKELGRYCESGQWLTDYQLDEAGLLPPELKRGVLSQDGLYDLLREIGL